MSRSEGARIVQECGLGWHARATEVARRIDAALAEREAQIMALRECIETQVGKECVVPGDPCRWHQVLTSTADAAARCVERAKAEGAEEMRKQAITLICEHCAAGNVPFLVEGQNNWTHEFRGGSHVSRGGCRAASIRTLPAAAKGANDG